MEKTKKYRYLDVLRADTREIVTTKRCQYLNQMMEVVRVRELYLEDLQGKERKQD